MATRKHARSCPASVAQMGTFPIRRVSHSSECARSATTFEDAFSDSLPLKVGTDSRGGGAAGAGGGAAVGRQPPGQASAARWRDEPLKMAATAQRLSTVARTLGLESAIYVRAEQAQRLLGWACNENADDGRPIARSHRPCWKRMRDSGGSLG